MEDLNLKGLWELLSEAIKNEEFEKAAYLETLISKRVNEEISYEMDRNTQIKHILEEFDFKKVARAMEAVGWFWIKNLETKKNAEGKLEVDKMETTDPTVDELMKRAYDLLVDVYNTAPDTAPTWEHSTGGLKATRYMIDGKKCLMLEFVFDEWFMDYDSVSNPNYS